MLKSFGSHTEFSRPLIEKYSQIATENIVKMKKPKVQEVATIIAGEFVADRRIVRSKARRRQARKFVVTIHLRSPEGVKEEFADAVTLATRIVEPDEFGDENGSAFKW